MTAFRQLPLDGLNTAEVAVGAGLSRYGNGFCTPPGVPVRGLTFPECIKRGATLAPGVTGHGLFGGASFPEIMNLAKAIGPQGKPGPPARFNGAALREARKREDSHTAKPPSTPMVVAA